MDCPDNLVARQSIDYGDIDGAFAKAAHRIKARFRLHKGGGHSIETRGIAVRLDPVDDTLTIYANTQMPHRAKQILVAALGVGEQRIRVVAPDTGGGFGPKAAFHPEELALPAAALLLRRPLKWMEDRRENFVADGRRARPGLGHGDGGRRRRPHARTARQALPRPRRLHAVRRGAGLQRRHQRDRPLRAAGVSARHQLVPDQLRAVRADARRRPPARHVRDGAAARRGRGEARHRARRGAAAQHDPAVADAVRDAGQAARRLDHDLRQRRLSGMPAPRAGSRRLGGFSGAAGGGAEARAAISGSASPTTSKAPGAGRSRARDLRVGASGKIVVTTGASAQGQGTKSMLAQLGVRRARRAAGGHRRDRRRHRGHRARLRRVRQPPGGDRGQRRASRRHRGAREGDQGRRRNAGGVGGGPGAEGRRGAGQRRAGDAEDPGADRARHRRRAGLCAAERRDAGARRVDRFPGAGADLLQRHARLRGRGRSRDRAWCGSSATSSCTTAAASSIR